MAPQVIDAQLYTIKCDVWSLGVVFYQTLCGFMPWDTSGTIEHLRESMSKGCSFPSALKISEAMQKLILSMLKIE